MTYRDMRNFTEMMRSLGYPRLISMENFRVPNFNLVAEILVWLVKRYDPSSDITAEVDTETDRVIFIKTVAQTMAIKAHVRLNTKKLYQADGYAVKEILKIVTQLYAAMKKSKHDENDSEGFVSSLDQSKIHELKEARRLASELTIKGANLSKILSKEPLHREQRNAVIARQFEITDVERGITASVKNVEAEIKKTQLALENVAADEANLEAKIEKKRNELERNHKRLATLQGVRPAFMDEYERHEEELSRLYLQYIVKFRNLSFLEDQYNNLCKQEMQRNEENQEQLHEVSTKNKAPFKGDSQPKRRGNEDDMAGLDDDDDMSDNVSSEDEGHNASGKRENQPVRPQAPTSGVVLGRRPPGASNFGGMNDEMDEESSDDDDEDNEDDLGDSDMDLSDDDSDLEDNGRSDKRNHRPQSAGRQQQASGQLEDSDDDF